MDIRLALTALGDHLIQHHGFSRAELCGQRTINRTTRPILSFRDWLLTTPQSLSYLADHGFPDLPALLTSVADQLKKDCNFGVEQVFGTTLANHTTSPIVRFLVWLEDCPEARQRLRGMIRSRHPISAVG